MSPKPQRQIPTCNRSNYDIVPQATFIRWIVWNIGVKTTWTSSLRLLLGAVQIIFPGRVVLIFKRGHAIFFYLVFFESTPEDNLIECLSCSIISFPTMHFHSSLSLPLSFSLPLSLSPFQIDLPCTLPLPYPPTIPYSRSFRAAPT